MSNNRWRAMVANNPDHSQRYADRWEELLRTGHDIDGEGRLIDAIAERGSTILDAGCGTGRASRRLIEAGHTVVGVDLDPVLIAAAQENYPQAEWIVGDLEDLQVEPGGPLDRSFDVIFSAGNVVGFLDPDLRARAIATLAGLLADGGKLVIGFGAGRGYEFADFFADLSAAGLDVQQRFSTWQLDPFGPESSFLVCIARRGSTPDGQEAQTNAAGHADGEAAAGCPNLAPTGMKAKPGHGLAGKSLL